MDDRHNFVVSRIKQPMGFNHFQALVGQGGGINGHLGAHTPGRMVQTLADRDLFQFFPAFPPEGSAGSRQENPFDILMLVPLKGLENGAVLTVHRGKPYPLLLYRSHYQAASRHQGFLVGQGNVLAGSDGGKGRFQPCVAHHGPQHRIGTAVGSHGHEPLLT